jgi:hypothetical protein
MNKRQGELKCATRHTVLREVRQVARKEFSLSMNI